MQINMHGINKIKVLYDLQGKSMPSTDRAEWLVFTCLENFGPSGNPEPGACAHTG